MLPLNLSLETATLLDHVSPQHDHCLLRPSVILITNSDDPQLQQSIGTKSDQAMLNTRILECSLGVVLRVLEDGAPWLYTQTQHRCCNSD